MRFETEKDGLFKPPEESLERFMIFALLCVWQVVNGLVGAFTAVDEFLEKVLKEHEETYNPDEVRDFVDIYIKTRSESEDTHLYTGTSSSFPFAMLNGRTGSHGEVGSP